MESNITSLQSHSVLQHTAAIIPGTTVTLQNGLSLHISGNNEPFIIRDGHLFPLSDPAAENLISRKHRFILKYAPLAILCGLSAAAFVSAIIWMLEPYPAIQEQGLYLTAICSRWLVTLFGVAFTVVFATMFIMVISTPRTVTKRTTKRVTSAIDGLCLVAAQTEHDTTFAARLHEAMELMAANEGGVLAILAIRFRDPVAHLYTKDNLDKIPTFDRAEGSMKWNFGGQFKGRTFAAESFADYESYVETVEPLVRNQWLKSRHQKAANPAEATTILANILRPTTIVLLLFVAPLAYGQKSKQVEQYLGTERYTMHRPVGKVKYVFAKAVLERHGDGKFSHKELLPSSAMFTDDENAGGLISIHVGADRLLPVRATASPAATEQPKPLFPERETIKPLFPEREQDPVRPRGLPGSSVLQPNWTIPDSMAMAKSIDGVKYWWETNQKPATTAAAQLWDLVMYFFYLLFPAALGALGICRYVAKTAANESLISIKGKTIAGGWIVSAQQNAAGFTLILAWVVVITFLINVFLFILNLKLPIALAAIVWFTVLWFGDRITDWLVPNLKLNKDTYK